MTEEKEKVKEISGNGFDHRAFMKQTFTPREGEVEVQALKDFFPDGKKPVWKVRGLTADEIARCNEAGELNKKVEAIAEALAAANKADISDGIKQMLGVSSDVHGEVAKRMQQLVAGSIEPKVPLDVAVKISAVWPAEFYDITNKILELTGLGQVAGKSKPSGKGKTSSQASISQT